MRIVFKPIERTRKCRKHQKAERAEAAQWGTSAAGPSTAHMLKDYMSKWRDQQRRSHGDSINVSLTNAERQRRCRERQKAARGQPTTSVTVAPNMREMRTEYKRLEQHKLNTITVKAQDFCTSTDTALTVLNCNTQSLRANADDISTDPVLQRCDYLALTETWMREEETDVSIGNYECVSRSNIAQVEALGMLLVVLKFTERFPVLPFALG